LAFATDAARRKNRQKNRKRRQRRPGPVSGIACLATDSTKILPSNSNKVAILLVKTARILCYNQRQIQNIQAMEGKMELVAYNDEAVTLRLKRKELGVLLAILQTFDVEFEKIDKELLMLQEPESEVKAVIDAIFAVSEKAPLSGERNVIK